jgi:hypothetical protein
MKKVLFLIALAVPVAILMAAEPVNTPFISSPNSFSIQMPDEYTLILDEVGYIGAFTALPKGNRLGVKFTPPAYPFKITQVAYALSDFPNYDRACNVVMFSEGLSGAPSSELGRKNGVKATAALDFYWVDVTSLNLTVNSGAFFVAVEYATDSFPAIAIDGSSPQHHASWFYTTFQDDPGHPRWEPFDNINSQFPNMTMGDTFDIMIRAKGTAPGVGEVELEPAVMAIWSSSIILASEGTVNYTLPEAGTADISLWDASGRLVKTIYSGSSAAGEHSISWNASGLANGAYFMRLKTATDVKVAKIILAN